MTDLIKNRYLLVLMCLCLITTQVENFQTDRNVYRFANGVKFDWIKEMYPVVDRWHHSYAIEIPSRILLESHRDLLVNRNVTNLKAKWFENCLLAQDANLHGTRNHSEFEGHEIEDRKSVV